MHRRDGVERFRRVQPLVLRKLDQHVDRVRPGELGVEPAARGDRLLLVRHLVGQAITWIKRGVEQRQPADHEEADDAIEHRAAHHLLGNQAAHLAQHVDGGIRAFDLGRKRCLLAYQKDSQQRHEGEDRQQSDDGGDEPCRPEGPDQVGIGEQQGDERQARGRVGEHAGRAHDQYGVAQRRVLVFAGEQPIARRKRQLHGIGEADHHDERRHHVEKHVEAEVEPTECAERQHDRNERRPCRHDHERDPSKEQNGDEASGHEADRIVDQPVALDRVADFELHDRHAR